MKILPACLLLLAAVFLGGPISLLAQTCPSVNLVIQEPAPTAVCKGDGVSVCAEVERIPGQCKDGSSYSYDQLTWKWEVTGVDASPSNGPGSCADFVVGSAGEAVVMFSLHAVASVCDPCPQIYTISHSFTVNETALNISKSWLGIDLTDAHEVDRLTATAWATAGSVAWGLYGSAGTVFDPNPPHGAEAVVKETGRPSATFRGETVSVTAAGCSDARPFTVVKVDIQAGIAEEDEEEPGMFIGVNDNDSDESGEPDNTEAPLLSEDPDLVPVTISVWPSDLPDDEVITLSGIENCYEDRRKMTNAASSYTMECVREGLTLYLEGAAPGEYTLTAQHPQSGARDKLKYTVLKAALTPDWNHNRRIDDEDANQASTNNPFRFWINDDADDGDISDGDSDVPEQGRKANCKNDKIDGRSDLTDFFPVWLDVGQILRQMPDDTQVECYLKQADDALNAVYTDLSKGNAGDFLIVDSKSYGPSFDKDSYSAPVFRVTAGGVKLSEEFVNKIKSDPSKGVLLFEGRATTQNPLVLEVRLDGKVVTEARLPMRIDGVEKMYRWINLRPGRQRDSRPGDPANNPDAHCNDKHFIFVHGYSVSEAGARGWNAEMFKRLYQAGSRAMFTAVTWFGNEGQVTEWLPWWLGGGKTPDYYRNVVNAFESSSNLAAAVNGLPGTKYIAGHSLGNMVVSSAIKDNRLSVNTYFMLNAAVATEAYKASALDTATMRHPDWQNYSNRLWATEWYQLFDSGDGRNSLTWRDRFQNISFAYNYFSSTEDVLENSDGSVPSIGRTQAWVNQEMRKGTTLMWLAPGNCEAGWGFNSDYDVIIGYDLQTELPVYARMPPVQAKALSEATLKTNSFFRHFDNEELYAPMTGSDFLLDGHSNVRDSAIYRRLLADAIPALSNPMGRNALSGFGRANVDFMDYQRAVYPIGWPRRDNDWRHSDIKDIAYPFTFRIFDKITQDGGLQ